MSTLARNVVLVCRMVKIEHSVFALPFAYIGAFLAAAGWPGWRVFLLLTAAMVAVRSFAMAVNRLVDADIDAENPRTQDRPLVTGELTRGFAAGFTAVCAVVFIAACAGLNWLCLALSPLALAWSAFYSITKRFTWACHFVLGSVLALAPVAGWIAYQPSMPITPVLFFAAVLFWVAGFDILYACQDVDFDRARGLYSVPARFGVGAGLMLALVCHAQAAGLFLLAGWAAGLGGWYFLVAGAVCAVLLAEHALVREDDLSRVNLAFFTFNGAVAVALFGGVLLDLWL